MDCLRTRNLGLLSLRSWIWMKRNCSSIAGVVLHLRIEVKRRNPAAVGWFGCSGRGSTRKFGTEIRDEQNFSNISPSKHLTEVERRMRQKRSKTYRKLLSSYILHFGYRPPFQLLIDSKFAHSLSALHLDSSEVLKRLSDVLQTSQLTKGKINKNYVAELKPMITQCCMVELYGQEKEGKIEKDAVTIAKSWERRRCNHREAISGIDCLKSVIGPNNKHRYILASDDRQLRKYLNEQVAGIPLVHTNQSRVIVLEPMSDLTKAKMQELERVKFSGLTPTAATEEDSDADEDDGKMAENVIVQSSSQQSNQAGPSSVSQKPVRGGPGPSTLPPNKRKKEANPLSNKKSKKVIEAEKAEKARRTREIAERTEAKRKAREAEQQLTEAPPNPSHDVDGKANTIKSSDHAKQTDVRDAQAMVKEAKTSKAKGKDAVESKMVVDGKTKRKDRDGGVDTSVKAKRDAADQIRDADESHQQKKRKRGSRGGSSAGKKSTLSE
ncbi:unnamed protein product [Sympodiomycopsis kandeliae]